ncbi:MAG: RNA-directed DNA polymerase [Erysipelotrichaceae bacterium]|nr:RNA-directed DNA polymerase [Erysipelotrichaceae bacterium]
MKHTYFELETLEKDLNVHAKTLYGLSNNINAHYHSRIIKKSNGGDRVLSVPDFILVKVQNQINDVILSRMPVSVYSKAYSAGDSPLGNAAPHLRNDTVIKLDIRQFFDHVTYPLVKEKVFRKELFSESNRILLSLLCMYNESLPQGAPTSPAISNILLYDFDNRIGEWCRQRNIIYTRYCDDMTFSGDFENWDPIDIIRKVKLELKQYGLFINGRKTKILHNGQRKKITGIVVNDKPNVSIDYRKKIRQEMHYIRKYGLKNHIRKTGCDKSEMEYLRSLLGRINYVLSVNRIEEYERYRDDVVSYLRHMGLRQDL